MTVQHKELAAGRWFELSLMEQLANVGSEVERKISWRKKNNFEYSRLAFERALELLDLTVSDAKNIHRLREILRAREALTDYFVCDNSYNSNDEQWKKYFFEFNYAARVNNN